jgi:hypothetical protein
MHGDHVHHPDDAKAHSHGEPFSEQDLAYFQTEDKAAGRAIISLMLGVFSLGLLGSIAICLVVRGS